MEEEQPFSKNQKIENAGKHRREHFLQYGFLILIFVFSVTILLQLENFTLRLVAIFLFPVFYFFWGLWHHFEEKNLTRSHVVEYLVVSLLILLGLAFVFIFR
ncbi:MAG: hypothetical protein WD187_01780 [Candidatus Woykebacteria bacterium]